MIRFVVWGAGDRGHIAAEIFGADRIMAFIDSDPEKAGGTFYGRPIIDFDCYKREYFEYAILVSLVNEQPVTEILNKEKIFFFSYNECPPELIGYGWKRAKNYIHKIKFNEKKVAVYGHTLYSILVYEYLEKAGYECVGLIQSQDLCTHESNLFNRLFPFIKVRTLSDIDSDTTILQTISEYGKTQNLHEYNVKDIYDWRKYIPDYINPRIGKLKNKYSESRCFIVATGPSLTLNDLERLNNNHEFSISMNSIFTCFDETSWRPDQYVAMDVDVINRFNSYYRKMDVHQKFIADASIDFDYDNLTEDLYIYHSIFSKYTLENGLISDDFSKYAYNSGTVTATCLQLAMYEGFKSIYLLGCDCSYFKTGIKHFKEIKEIKEMPVSGYAFLETSAKLLKYHINAYEKIKEYADSRGIKIYNATRGGYLEVFERVNFDELFNI